MALNRKKVAIGLGSNLGDSQSKLKEAAEKLRDDVLYEAVSSSVYSSAPWGMANQPDFCNAVVVGVTEWQPPALLTYLKALERDMGRESAERNGPRLIDLDLLTYGEERWESEAVEVPHPRMHLRDFVLLPLAEVWPEWRHPSLAATALELHRELEESERCHATVIAPPLLGKETP